MSIYNKSPLSNDQKLNNLLIFDSKSFLEYYSWTFCIEK